MKLYKRGCSVQNSPTIPRDSAIQFLNKLAPPFVPLENECPVSSSVRFVTDSPLEAPFSLTELNAVLDYVKDSSPGLDGFPYSFYKKSGECSRQFILDLMNLCFGLGYIPDAWKSQLIIPILKPGKTPDHPDHYRPIALSCVLGKIFEHLLKNRLEWFIESKGLIDKSQFGFRKGLSTMDVVSIFITDTRISLSQNQSVLACFLDISAAYDSVLLSVLRCKLCQLNVPAKMTDCILSFLAGRSVCVHIPGDDIGTTRMVWRGLPQGSVLSPLLYNIYTSDLHRSLNIDCNILQYADDLCLYLSNSSIDVACDSIQVSLNSLNNWLSSHGLNLSASKSSVVVFSRKRNSPNVHLKIEGSPIKVEDKVRFLGVILDSKLTGISHINFVVSKCEKNLNLLRALAGVWWGAHPLTLKLVYNAIIRSILDYGTFLLEPCNKTAIAKLDSIQAKALRCILGCMRSSPINALQVECVDPPLHLRRQYLADRFMYRSYFFKNHILISKLSQLDRLCTHTDYWRHRVPPLILNCFRKIHMVEQNICIQQCNRLPFYDSQYESLVFCPNYFPSIGLDKESPHTNAQFSYFVDEKWSDYHKFYTDASKIDSSSKTGFSVYYSNYKIILQFQCPPQSSVFTGECIAILEACLFIMSHVSITKAVIFSDSRSALEAIVKNPFKDKLRSPIISEIRNCLYSCSQKLIDVILVWIPSHSGITGNEIADSEAKGAIFSSVADLKHYSVQIYDLLHQAKSDLYRSWQSSWDISSKTKGKLYASIQQEIPVKPWFSKFKKAPKTSISVICRIRIGHCCSPVFLHKIRIRDSSLCECGLDDGSVDHIFLNCQLYNSQFSLVSITNKLKVPRPFNVFHLLSLFPDRHIISGFIKFVHLNKIKL